MTKVLRSLVTAATATVVVGAAAITAPIVDGFDEVAQPIATGDTFVEEVVVWSTNAENDENVSRSLTPLIQGVTYAFEAEGTYFTAKSPDGSTGILPADAECSSLDGSAWQAGTGNAFDLIMSGNADPDWQPLEDDGSACSNTHRYRIEYVPTTTAPVAFWVQDGWHGDNSGSLTVRIYQHTDLSATDDIKEEVEQTVGGIAQKVTDEIADRRAETEQELADRSAEIEEMRRQAEEDATTLPGQIIEDVETEAEQREKDADEARTQAEQDAADRSQELTEEAARQQAAIEQAIDDADPGPIADAVVRAITDIEDDITSDAEEVQEMLGDPGTEEAEEAEDEVAEVTEDLEGTETPDPLPNSGPSPDPGEDPNPGPGGDPQPEPEPEPEPENNPESGSPTGGSDSRRSTSASSATGTAGAGGPGVAPVGPASPSTAAASTAVPSHGSTSVASTGRGDTVRAGTDYEFLDVEIPAFDDGDETDLASGITYGRRGGRGEPKSRLPLVMATLLLILPTFALTRRVLVRARHGRSASAYRYR